MYVGGGYVRIQFVQHNIPITYLLRFHLIYLNKKQNLILCEKVRGLQLYETYESIKIM